MENHGIPAVWFNGNNDHLETGTACGNAMCQIPNQQDAYFEPCPYIPPYDQELVKHYFKRKIDAEVNAQMKAFDFQLKETHAENNLKRNVAQAEAYDKIRRERELSVTSVTMSREGKLLLQHTSPSGDITASGIPILNVVNPSMICFSAEGSSQTLCIIVWEGCTDPVIIDENTTATCFAKKLASSGVAFSVSKDLKHDVSEQVLAFLKSNAKTIRLPLCFGWTKRASGWHFAWEDELTLDSICKECGASLLNKLLNAGGFA